MKTFVRVVNGVVVEIIQPMRWAMPSADKESLYSPDLWALMQELDGQEVEMAQRFPAAFRADCVEILADSEIATGWQYSGGDFFPPATPAEAAPPSGVTMRQARLALLAAGKLSAVKSAIDSLAGHQGEAARIEWEFAATVERGSPIVAMLAAAVGLDASGLDELFTAAAAL